MDCLFCKIIKNEIPGKVVCEDESTLAFMDIMPVAKGHVLVIPKRHCEDITEMTLEDMASVMKAAQKIGSGMIKAGYEGFNIQMNNRTAAGQVIFHAHMHVVPRKSGDGLKLWPGKSYADGEIEEYQEKIISGMQES